MLSPHRQESHRIYLQLFTPKSTKSRSNDSTRGQLHRHDSHDIHPPNYPSMTTATAGAPYHFSSSTSLSLDSSYSFSSSRSSDKNIKRGLQNQNDVSQQHAHQPPYDDMTITTSAAVRLTDRAFARDVTSLLRGKFGLPDSERYDNNIVCNSSMYAQRGERERGYDNNNMASLFFAGGDLRGRSEEPSRQHTVSMDALVLVGTLEGPPKGYVAFEHEEEQFGMCEQRRLRCLREREIYWRCLHQQQQQQEEYLNQQQQQYQSKLQKLDEEKVQELNATSPSSLPASSSSATVRASGNTQKGYTHSQSSLAMSIPSSSIKDGRKSSLDMSSSRDSKMGLDLSSSSQYHGGGSSDKVPWSAGVGGGVLVEGGGSITPSKDGGGKNKVADLFSDSLIATTLSPPRGGNVATATNVDMATMQFPSIPYEPDLEPIHIIRTLHPDEHPLQVRDEMIKSLERLRKRAEEQMGLVDPTAKNNAHNISSPGRGGSSRRQQLQQQQQPHVSVRWYFQPCSPLGGMDSTTSSSPKIQSIPAFIELDGYCTDDDDDGGDNNKSDDDMHGRGFDDEYDHDVTDDEDVEGNQTATLSMDEMTSANTSLLNKEKRRIAALRELSDSPFVVSGYLLKQSQKDPNVWRRMYCVLAVDRLWVIGRVKLLSEFPNDQDVGGTMTNQDVLSSLRVGSHSYINLLRSILIEREEPLNHRLPNTFRIVTSLGKTHSFRAFNSQSFQSWTAALSEKIAQTHTDGMMDLAHVITEEETLARCRRMEDIAVTPFLSSVPVSTETTPFSMDTIRFGMAIAEYRELCRKVDEAMQLYKNSGGVVNVQTRVGGSPNSKANRASLSSLSASQRAKNEAMVSSVWEDARVVASKSAQLLHAIATSRHSILEAVSVDGDANQEEEKIQNSMGVDNHSMKDLIDEQKDIQTLLSRRWKHQVTPEADSDDTEIDHLPPLNLFDNLLKHFHSFCSPTGLTP